MTTSESSKGRFDYINIFPYDKLRPYQSEFLQFINRNDNVMIHAITGFGKTAMSLLSIIPQLKREKAQLYIFVRTKAQIFETFIKTLNTILNNREYGYITVLPLILKSELCILDGSDYSGFYRGLCSGIKCKYLKMAKNILEEDLPVIAEQVSISEQLYTLREYKKILKEFGCPYHVIKRCLPVADIIVTTHTYLNSNLLRELFLKKFLLSLPRKKIALIDEAHNFSYNSESQLDRATLQKAREIYPFSLFDTLESLIGKNKRIFRPNVDEEEAIFEAYINNAFNILPPKKRNKLIKVKDFLQAKGDIWISLDDTITQINPFPSKVFEFVSQYFDKSLLMSGTFQPLSFYQKLYGTSNFQSLIIPQQYPFVFKAILKDPRYCSRFTNRSDNLYTRMASLIYQLHTRNPFHTAIFSPSYEIHTNLYRKLNQVVASNDENANIYLESSDPSHITDMITELKHLRHELFMGVLGGRLSEGVEIVTDKLSPPRSLISLIIITGLPYPPPNVTHEVVFDLYTKRFGRSSQALLTDLPIIRNVLQATGRGIRQFTDFNASIILDYRAISKQIFTGKTHTFSSVNHLLNETGTFFNSMIQKFDLSTFLK